MPRNSDITDAPREPPDRGRVWFVGAGPGHPDLVTVRALDRLGRADCIVHDALVPTAILDLAPASAERIAVPRENPGLDPGHAAGMLLARLAGEGRRVVRLKGGDPAVFARLAEELAPLREAGVPFEIVPGVTAILAAAAAAGIPLTSRSSASHLTIVTAHEAGEKNAPLDLAALAALPGTLAVYMGVARVSRWAADLLAAGRDAATPVAVVSRCSWPDQRTALTTLGECAEDFRREGWPSPAVVIVGEVAAAIHAGARLPLAGRRVLVTRPAGQSDDLATAIVALGGECLQVPVLRIAPPESWEPLDSAIREAGTFDWIVFASVNGVEAFLARMRAARVDARALGTARLMAIGPATAGALEAGGLVCDLQPASSTSEGVVATLLPTLRQGRVLLVRADRGRDVMRRELQRAGHTVVEVAAYRSLAVESLDAPTASLIDAAPIDCVTITSAAVAESAARLFGTRMRSWNIASISPITTAALVRLGFQPASEATATGTDGLLEAIVRAVQAGGAPGAGPSPPPARPGQPLPTP